MLVITREVIAVKSLERDLDQSWIIHVYGPNRRLVCTLDPSHGWVFAVGLVLGLMVGVGASSHSATTPPTHSQAPANSSTLEAPLQLD